MKNYLSIFLFLVCQIFFGQTNTPAWQVATKTEVIEAYQKACDWFVKTNSYKLKLKYVSYKNHISNEIKETSEGNYMRSANNYKTEALGILTEQNNEAKVVVDTLDKLIIISNPEALKFNLANTTDLLSLLNNTKSLKKKVAENNSTYRIDFKPNVLYDAYEFTVNTKGILESLVFYYSEKTEQDYGNMANEEPIKIKIKPRLAISFYDYETNVKLNEKDFKVNDIVFNDAKKITLLNKYKHYQLKDYRYSKK